MPETLPRPTELPQSPEQVTPPVMPSAEMYNTALQENIANGQVSNELLAQGINAVADRLYAVSKHDNGHVPRAELMGGMLDVLGAVQTGVPENDPNMIGLRIPLSEMLIQEPMRDEQGNPRPLTLNEARMLLIEQSRPGNGDILTSGDIVGLASARSALRNAAIMLRGAPREYHQATQMRTNANALRSLNSIFPNTVAESQDVQRTILNQELKQGVAEVGQVLIMELARLDPNLNEIAFMHNDLRDKDGKLEVTWEDRKDASSVHRSKAENHSQIEINPQTVQDFDGLFQKLSAELGVELPVHTQALALEYIAAHELGHAVSARFGSKERISGKWVAAHPEQAGSPNADDAKTIEEESFAEGAAMLVLEKLLVSKYGASKEVAQAFLGQFAESRNNDAADFVALLHQQPEDTRLKDIAQSPDAAAHIGYGQPQTRDQLRDRMLFILDKPQTTPEQEQTRERRFRRLGQMATRFISRRARK